MSSALLISGAGALLLTAIGGMKVAELYAEHQHRKALNGVYGDLRQWKAELRENRPGFLATYNSLPQRDRIYVRNVAETKSEFIEEATSCINQYLEGASIGEVEPDDLDENV